MENLSERVEALESTMSRLAAEKQAMERRLRAWRGMAGALAVVGLLVGSLNPVDAQAGFVSLTAELKKLMTRVDTLEAASRYYTERLKVIDHFSRDGEQVIITGANLHIRNRTGATDRIDGTGNLIIGYNELRGGGQDRRGSHNLVVGPLHSYPNFGGLVAGWGNEVLGPYATVCGGRDNRALRFGAAVLGGTGNVVDGENSAIVGGLRNRVESEAGGVAAADTVVLGGESCVARGLRNVILGELGTDNDGRDRVRIHPWLDQSSRP